MSSTNKTVNYNLPQWVGTDHPTFLGDFNGAFETIDTAMKENKTEAETATQTATSAKTLSEEATQLANEAKQNSENAVRVEALTCETFDNMYIMVGNKPPQE